MFLKLPMPLRETSLLQFQFCQFLVFLSYFCLEIHCKRIKKWDLFEFVILQPQSTCLIRYLMTTWDWIFEDLFQCRFSTGATQCLLILCIPADSPPFRNVFSPSASCKKALQFSEGLVLQTRPCLRLAYNTVTMNDLLVSPVVVERWFQCNFRWLLAG